MSRPKRRRTVTVRGAPSPDTHTTAAVKVVEKRSGGATYEVGGASVEIEGAGASGRGKTKASGIFKTKLIRAGRYNVVVTAPGMGPIPPAGQAVKTGPFKRKFTFVPNTALPKDKETNEITIELARESPRIRITVLEKVGSGTVPLPGATVVVTNFDKGSSDAAGKFVTREVVPRKYDVLVKKSGYFPQNQDGNAFFRRVEITDRGYDLSTGSMDLQLEVVLAKTRPKNIPPFVPDPVRIWASGTRSPSTVDPDPRLPADTPKGQAGWDMGIQFSSFADLAAKLHGSRGAHLGGGAIADHQVSRLALVAHGMPGIVDVDQHETGAQGAPTPIASRSLTVARLGAYAAEIALIGRALRQDSVVILAACQASDGSTGEALIKALSKAWPTTYVVAPRTLAAIVNGMSKPGTGNLMFAGARDTRYAHGKPDPKIVRDHEDPKMIADLTRLPWLSENSPHATVARDGNIIRRGEAASGSP